MNQLQNLITCFLPNTYLDEKFMKIHLKYSNNYYISRQPECVRSISKQTKAK